MILSRVLLDNGINISMDSKGRALDNIFIERLWRDVKHQHIYLYDYQDGKELYEGLSWYFRLHNEHKPHQSLNYKTPAQVYYEKSEGAVNNTI